MEVKVKVEWKSKKGSQMFDIQHLNGKDQNGFYVGHESMAKTSPLLDNQR